MASITKVEIWEDIAGNVIGLVFDPTGRLVREFQPAAVSYSFNLPAGPYLITVCSDAVTEGRTFKVAVGH